MAPLRRPFLEPQAVDEDRIFLEGPPAVKLQSHVDGISILTGVQAVPPPHPGIKGKTRSQETDAGTVATLSMRILAGFPVR